MVAVTAALIVAAAFAAPMASASGTGSGTGTPLTVGSSPTTVATMPATTAWVLVDADTGNVLAADNDRTPLPPASLTKVITALAASNLAPSTPITVSAQAAAAPADKINLKVGQVWTADELFHALLISSANDAAVALAQQVGGSVAGFQTVFAQTAQEIGMADNPVLRDPAGLDGPEGVGGGNLVSARDLAMAGRTLLADPYLAAIVATQVYDFEGPDNIEHNLVSHNKAFLSTYPGAIGIKTGFTDRAGTCLMAAAQRNGRTMLAVVLHSANPTAAAKLLLDRGFATPVSAEPTADRLPAVDLAALKPKPTTADQIRSGPPTAVAAPASLPVPDRPAAPIAVAALAGPGTTSPSFGLLSAGGALALLLCLAVLIGTRGRRRYEAPNLWAQRDPWGD